MVFNSINYLFFFSFFIVIYYGIPRRYRYLLLLLGSYFFYACWDTRYVIFLLLVTTITYTAAFLPNRIHGSAGRRALLALSFFLCFLPLFLFKYYNFTLYNLKSVLKFSDSFYGWPQLDVVLPVGISFYTFQAMGYVFDVYRGKVETEKNFLRYAAFVSFFPNLLSGPIERADNLLKQMRSEQAGFDLEKIRRGLLEIAWGLFLKMVLSNHISPVVDEIFDHYTAYRGIEFVIATFLFGIQIYCDFAGYSHMAIGSARVLGYELRKNFDLPYFSKTTGEFWRRWHISLTSWFRDYLYIPLGGNRKGKLRKYINTMTVFAVSGLWHGASWAFVFWGVLNGLFVVAGDIRRNLCAGRRHTVSDGRQKLLGCISAVGTFILVDYAWMFFRADSFSQGFAMTKSILLDFWPDSFSVADLLREFGGIETLAFLAVIVGFLFFVEYLQYRTGDLIRKIFGLSLPVRWGIYLGLLFLIIVFGIYGYSYEQTQFIYFEF